MFGSRQLGGFSLRGEKNVFSIIRSRKHNMEEGREDHMGPVTKKKCSLSQWAIKDLGEERESQGFKKKRKPAVIAGHYEGRAALCDSPGGEVQPPRHHVVCLNVYMAVVVGEGMTVGALK